MLPHEIEPPLLRVFREIAGSEGDIVEAVCYTLVLSVVEARIAPRVGKGTGVAESLGEGHRGIVLLGILLLSAAHHHLVEAVARRGERDLHSPLPRREGEAEPVIAHDGEFEHRVGGVNIERRTPVVVGQSALPGADHINRGIRHSLGGDGICDRHINLARERRHQRRDGANQRQDDRPDRNNMYETGNYHYFI